ncbi:L,D-transpeptidase family protein [Acinetobacter sp. ANC 4648]|uniref:L,D-transpeptidase family protein n=1 Tax=Acinetobacter sp. ANC 4648 TaxID=1977875 RepID=UPI000A32BC0E|nr:L,D-transpeptidase [Acinetobacter sp. ANC 4648]OTG83662.1 murein L,D-transpeptidase [Acinetobacter sp. ANC 4648]
MGKLLPKFLYVACIVMLNLPSQSFAIQTVAATVKNNSAPIEVQQVWTLESLNKANWAADLGRGQFPAYARAQVMLNNLHASPGAIDGKSGKNFLKALATYQQIQGFPLTGELTKQTWDSLIAKQSNSAFGVYVITEQDLKGPFAKSIPRNYALQAKMPGLYYTRMTEMLGEKFHIDEEFLRQLNPKAAFNNVGEKILVPNVRNELPHDVSLIIAHKGARQLYLFNGQNRLIASFPATIGGSETPSPKGTHKVVKVAANPYYGYSPKNFVQGANKKPLVLPSGPNGPVGNIWIALSKASFGIHGTPNPSLISKTASHGCIRLTNWDANDLGRKVQSGVVVKFLE